MALAAVAGTLVVMACGGSPAAEPVAPEHPPPADTAAPPPEPEGSPEPESPLPEPEGSPEPESPLPEPEGPPPEPLAIHVDADTIWRDVFDALGSSEQSCIRSALDDDPPVSVLDRRILADADSDSEEWVVSIFTCLTPDDARSLFLAVVVAGLEVDMEELSTEQTSCLREQVADLDVVALVAPDASDEDLAALMAVGLSLARCVPDVLLGEVLGVWGVDADDLSGEEMSCLRESAAGIDLDDLGTDLAGDEAVGAALVLSLWGCVP